MHILQSEMSSFNSITGFRSYTLLITITDISDQQNDMGSFSLITQILHNVSMC